MRSETGGRTGPTSPTVPAAKTKEGDDNRYLIPIPSTLLSVPPRHDSSTPARSDNHYTPRAAVRPVPIARRGRQRDALFLCVSMFFRPRP